MPNASKSILIICLSVCLLAACSTKNTARLYSVESGTPKELSSLPSFSKERQYLSGSVKMTVSADGEESTLRGRMRVDAGRGVQIGVVAMNMVEVACFEFYPFYARIIHKMEKLYSDVPYKDMPVLNRLGIDYGTFEALLLNKVYAGDGVQLSTGCEVSADDGCIVLRYGDPALMQYGFCVEKATGNLLLAERMYPDGMKVQCRYSDFKPVGNTYFPHRVELSLDGGEVPAKMVFEFSGLRDGEFEFTPRRIGDSYEKVDVDRLIMTGGV